MFFLTRYWQPFRAKIFTVAAEQKALAPTPSYEGARGVPHVEGVIYVFSNTFGTEQIQETWMSSREPFNALFFILFIPFLSPHLLQLFKTLC